MTDLNSEKIVYFVRHGQSAGNAAPVFQAPDSPLNEKGREQAEKIAERISKLSFEVLITSPFQRAKETAEAIAKASHKEPEYSDLFAERAKPTSVSGKPHADEKADAAWREWEKSLYTSGVRRVEDGENFDDLIARADNALAFLKDRTEQSLVVVTHGFFLRIIIARVLFGDLLSGELLKKFQKATRTENTGITVLRYQAAFEESPAWRLWIYNDHAHLG
jgi:broad specificity phosphatase PhoE